MIISSKDATDSSLTPAQGSHPKLASVGILSDPQACDHLKACSLMNGSLVRLQVIMWILKPQVPPMQGIRLRRHRERYLLPPLS
jgi:hypothetical protein